ncbi:MAG TPA: argininosuccinate lyase [Nitrospiria bacterium]|jgi:argininosuccinate lyase|nr:argininosuccinate lyase [Nitrospiria bacterium]
MKKNSKNKKMWSGRFTAETHRRVEAFTASLPFDRRLYPQDIAGSIAWARALSRAKVLTQDEADRITEGLKAVRITIEEGRAVFEEQDEDIHMAVERLLTERIGELGGKLHTGRSRNDQVALDLRLYLRDEMKHIIEAVKDLQDGLVAKAKSHVDVILPGYTHLQKAQPIRYAHYLLAYYEMLERDRQRFLDGFQRVNVMPLGSGALAGTNYPINREELAEDLGFPAVTENSLDAVSDRDGAIEFLAAAGILMMHLSRFCEELVLWSTDEFGYLELPDAFCTGSSLMPQKKNPDVPELIRAKTGRVYGHLMALLTVMKGLPLAYNRDLQEDKEAVFDSVDTVKTSLSVLTEMIPGITLRREAAAKAAENGFLLATEAADYLVEKGLPFRQAHEVVGRIVRYCLDQGRDFRQLSIKELQKFSDHFQKDVIGFLDLEASVERKQQTGATARNRILERIRRIEEK